MNHDDSRGLNIKCFQIYYKCKNDDVKCFRTSHHNFIQTFFFHSYNSQFIFITLCVRDIVIIEMNIHFLNATILFLIEYMYMLYYCAIQPDINKRICYVTCGNLISSLISMIMYNLKEN